MYCDLPLLKRCCFCLPLRPGLIAWGYIKTTTAVAFIIMLLLILVENINNGHYRDTSLLVVHSLLLTVATVDAAFSIMFLISAHKKNHKLMRSFLYYHVVVFIISNMIFLLFIIYMSYLTYLVRFFLGEIWLTFGVAFGFLNAVFQFYVILLIRSVIHKLSNDCCFKFENHAAAAQCHMNNVNIKYENFEVAPKKQDKLELIKEEFTPSKD